MKKTGAMGATPMGTKPIGKIAPAGVAAKPAAVKSSNPISRLGAYAHPKKKGR